MKVVIEEFVPSKGKMACIKDFINLRNGTKCVDESCIYIILLNESFFYQRVDDYSEVRRFVYDEDGMLHVNFPNPFKDSKEDKDKSNMFFPKGSIGIIMHIRNKDLKDEDASKVLTFMKNGIFEIVKKRTTLEHLAKVGNDIFFDGKKFYGEEITGTDECYSISSITTCNFKDNEYWFDKLIGKGNYAITGITDELPEVTQEVIAQELYEKAKNIFD